jgi:3-(3-hydroxy-phenyl)propionate hydroxylase
LTAEAPFARSLINSGRLSTPTVYSDTPLSTPDAPLRRRTDGSRVWLLNLLGPRFTLLYSGEELPCTLPAHVRLLRIGWDVDDEAGLFQQRFDARPGSAFLVRPDQHLCARFRRIDARTLEASVRRALGWELAR